MKALALPSVGFLSIVLLLVCFSGITAAHEAPVLHGGNRVVRKDNDFEAHHPDRGDEEPTDYGYGPPPPYYTGQPTASTESGYEQPPPESTSKSRNSKSESQESTVTETMPDMDTSSVVTSASTENSAASATSEGEMETTAETAFSSAKGGGATRSATLSSNESSVTSNGSISVATSGATASGSETGSEAQSSATATSYSTTSGYSFSTTSSQLNTTDNPECRSKLYDYQFEPVVLYHRSILSGSVFVGFCLIHRLSGKLNFRHRREPHGNWDDINNFSGLESDNWI
ncbi:hypothetical protein QQX98_002673 [Neonectria punicea]|uniref:Uncharacterized protein n=1 Tax=Neonectria punicea TaxID=979145 RepID=A0ABR1HIX3_9HYPO